MKVSVIIAVYNEERYLRECVDSVLDQTFRDYELILVDDGSMDSSGQICDSYSLSDSRVRVIHKKNEGLICARKEGVESAKGEFVVFVDADDWVEKDFLEFLVEEMELNKADIVALGCMREEINNTMRIVNKIKNGIYKKDKLINEVWPQMLYYQGFYEFGILPYLCNKIFKRNILADCYVNVNTDISNGEDAAVVYPYLLKINKAVICSESKYHYRIHKDAMTARKDANYYSNVANLYLYLYEIFKKNEYAEYLIPQLDQYMRKMVWQKEPESFIEAENYLFPFDRVVKGAKVIIYGAGRVGKTYLHQIRQIAYCEIVLWVDKKFELYQKKGYEVYCPNKIAVYTGQVDYLIIAIANILVAEEVADNLSANYGINRDKLIY